ncbi:hypothetical protein [Clostridium perfringens]|uniref:hypothetical protein n=1 Tax=Clostridium perfringens TaxID=1502 RepID=UPI0024BBF7F4|nr:hypothetical protein [Clostridium perfringens]EIW6614797.1 hypothetical protein [Clostridium perfringens]
MKVFINCMKCLEEFRLPNINFIESEINDDGIYKATCNRGHETVTFLQQDKFEVLFDMGAMALIDGYPREAVSSFAASLERFYEFCIKVFLLKRRVNMDKFNNTWKLVSSQSERQLGAFYFLYLDVLGEIPKSINKRQVEFRNKVIHKGYIPKYDEVVKYADCSLTYMYEILKELRECCKEEIHQVTANKLNNMSKEFIKDGKITAKISTMSIPTIINLVASDEYFAKKSFMEALEDMKEYYLKFYSK